MTDNTPVNLDVVRREIKWGSGTTVSEIEPEEALLKLVDDIRAGVVEADHVVVFYGNTADEHGVSTIGYRQAGAYTRLETVGMVEEGKTMLLGLT